MAAVQHTRIDHTGKMSFFYLMRKCQVFQNSKVLGHSGRDLKRDTKKYQKVVDTIQKSTIMNSDTKKYRKRNGGQEMAARYYGVSFHYGNGIYCSNIAHGEYEAVKAHYESKYDWVKVGEECREYEITEAKRRGMPIVEI